MFGARLPALLLEIASIGLFISASFPTDVEGAHTTRTGDIHTLSFMVNVRYSRIHYLAI
jgi:hypothetical protein